MISASYRYDISAILILEKENITFWPESIISVTIDSNYDVNNRPIIYLSYNLQSRIYDKLVLNSEKAVINFRIKKRTNGSASSIGKDYIHDQFSYIIKTDPDYYRSLKEKSRVEDKLDEDEYVRGVIALFKKDSMDNIKKLYCDIIKNSTMASILHKYTKDRKMVISPLASTKVIDNIIIPPVESLSELIEFLNGFDALYERKYRYFEDFDITYILDGSGAPIHGEDQYDNIIIHVLEASDPDSKEPGIKIDKTRRAYLMYVDAQDTSMDIDLVSNIEYNQIIGVSSTGEITKRELNHGSNSDGEKILIQRVFNDNSRIINNIRNEMDSSSVIIQMTKTETDGSIFTPNKEYLVKNYTEYSQYDGRFILAFKKEVIIQQDGEFISSIIIGLRKIME